MNAVAVSILFKRVQRGSKCYCHDDHNIILPIDKQILFYFEAVRSRVALDFSD